MTLRNRTRAFVIQAATLFRTDALALHAQRRRAQGIVIAMHETPARLQTKFREQLEWASQHFTITSLDGFAQIWTERETVTREQPLLLYTFDDGRESNYRVAAPLLESFGGRGLFFVVPAFSKCADHEQALSFYRTRINPGLRRGQEDAEDWLPMNPDQIADLAARGHAIGNHTLTHEKLVGLSPEQLEREIGESAHTLTAWTKRNVDAFAWTFGWDAIDANAWNVVRRYHRFCFSPCAGAVNGLIDQPSLLWRREIELRYSPSESRFFYSGLADVSWSGRRARLRRMLTEPSAQ
ncbi:MAG TPA: polysaccharide deacetylase family protein [Candidatus Sulfotelmatobacter sp.]|jgi:peptidoglycan/xylan/chitin deacetylase (PgdA/CDA1 family)